MSLPTSDAAKWVATLMRRRLTTHWSVKEVRQFRILVKQRCFDNAEDLALMEAYYKAERKKGENGCYRRDLYTLINNFQSELDRATAWREQHPLKQPPRKIIPLPPLPSNEPMPLFTPDELEGIQKFQQQFSEFKKVRQIMGK